MKKDFSKNINIGVDIEDVKRFQKLNLVSDKTFLGKIFTKNELVYCFSKKNKAEHLAGRFSAKESILKALRASGADYLVKGEADAALPPSQRHYLDGVKYFQNADYEKAREEWKKAKKLDPSNPEVAAGLKRIDQILAGSK